MPFAPLCSAAACFCARPDCRRRSLSLCVGACCLARFSDAASVALASLCRFIGASLSSPRPLVPSPGCLQVCPGCCALGRFSRGLPCASSAACSLPYNLYSQTFGMRCSPRCPSVKHSVACLLVACSVFSFGRLSKPVGRRLAD